MIVYSSASGQPLTVSVHSATYVGGADYVPAVYYVARRLHPLAHNYAVLTASETASEWRQTPRYMLTDCHGDGCAAYSQPHYSLVPALTDWQSEVIEAVRHLRRWRYYSDTPTD